MPIITCVAANRKACPALHSWPPTRATARAAAVRSASAAACAPASAPRAAASSEASSSARACAAAGRGSAAPERHMRHAQLADAAGASTPLPMRPGGRASGSAPRGRADGARACSACRAARVLSATPCRARAHARAHARARRAATLTTLTCSASGLCSLSSQAWTERAVRRPLQPRLTRCPPRPLEQAGSRVARHSALNGAF